MIDLPGAAPVELARRITSTRVGTGDDAADAGGLPHGRHAELIAPGQPAEVARRGGPQRWPADGWRDGLRREPGCIGEFSARGHRVPGDGE
eukprot:COSAG02_NODE_4022_length_5891_cov_111.561119_6_plen_91_part_00